MRIYAAVLVCCIRLCFGCARAQGRTVAITVDDLPYAAGGGRPGSLPASAALMRSVNDRILASLRGHHAAATGFVVGRNAEELGIAESEDVLKAWTADGFSLGNHTYSHDGANSLSLQQFEADVVRGETSFLPLVDRARDGLFLRFPYNQTGDTMEKHEGIASFLKERGYRVAPCTIDTEDYAFNAVYVQMLGRKDETGAQRLREAYLQYTSEEIDYYSGLNRQVLGYEPPQIMLLHDSKLNADTMDAVLDLFAAKGYRFVSLTEAEQDPIYRGTDAFVTKYGMMWGYRWAQERHVKLTGRKEQEPPVWIEQYGAKP